MKINTQWLRVCRSPPPALADRTAIRRSTPPASLKMSMFSFLSRKNMPPGSPGPGGANGPDGVHGGPPSVDDVVADLKREWDRRLEALSMCLDEKSQENTQLHKLLREREESEKQLKGKIASLEVDLQAEKDVVREHQRRLEAMTRVLEDSIMHPGPSAGILPQFSDIENEKFLTPDEVAARKASTSSETAAAMDNLPGSNFGVGKSPRGVKPSAASATSPTKRSNADPEPDASESDKKQKSKTDDKKSSDSSDPKPIKRAEKVGAKTGNGTVSPSASSSALNDASDKEEEDPLKISEFEERDPMKALTDHKLTILKVKKVRKLFCYLPRWHCAHHMRMLFLGKHRVSAEERGACRINLQVRKQIGKGR